MGFLGTYDLVLRAAAILASGGACLVTNDIKLPFTKLFCFFAGGCSSTSSASASASASASSQDSAAAEASSAS